MPVKCFCNNCGKPFVVKLSRGATRRYCSHGCRTKQITRFCVCCGGAFSIPISTASKGGFFCSAECYVKTDGLAKQAHMIKGLRGKHAHNFAGCRLTCPQCKKAFYVPPSLKDIRKFCSQRCKDLSRTVDNPLRYKRTVVNGKKIEEHRQIAKRILDYGLKSNQLVHHINERKRDNEPRNLIIVTKSQHGTIHLIHRNRGIMLSAKEILKMFPDAIWLGSSP